MNEMSLNIICIDDDEFMLKAIGRLVRRIRPEWKAFYSVEPCNWKQAWIDSQHDVPDIFISDLLMPKKQGDKLLEEIKDEFPNVIRVLLTGDTAQSLPEKAHSYAHFVLPKPFTEEDFEHLFLCAERLHKMPFNNDCRRKLGALSDLPLLPNTVTKLQKTIASPSCDIHKIAEVVSHEPALVARIFQIANSPYFGFRRSTDSLPEAVGRLGATLVESLAVTQLSRITHKHSTLQVHKEIAEKALKVGSVARMIAKQLQLGLADQDKVFVASLLTSIGALMLLEEGAKESELDSFIGLQTGYNDSHVVAAFVLIMWGYDIDIGDIILKQQTLDFDSGDADTLRGSIVGLATSIVELEDIKDIKTITSTLPREIRAAVSELVPLLS